MSTFATLPAKSSPLDLAFDGNANLFASNGGINQINEITPAGIVSLFATLPADNGAAGVAFDASGNLLFVDNNNSSISKIAPNGTITPFASGVTGAEYIAFGPDPVPEPSSVVLAALGFSVLTRYARRRRSLYCLNRQKGSVI